MGNFKNATTKQPKKSRLKKVILRIVLSVIIIFFLIFLAFKFSPWPSALLIRHYFNKEGVKVNKALKKYAPDGITAILNQQYDPSDRDAFLDIYYPSNVSNTNRQLPVIVWVHGGGWVAGSKENIANYCKILAGKGYAVVSVGYSLAPGKHYPTPVKQVNIALSYLQGNAKKFHIDPSHFILAGDSGGAHIAAQTGAIISNTDYGRLIGISPSIGARQLSGVILYCGPYDAQLINPNSDYNSFNKSVLWAYIGKKDFVNHPLYKTVSVINYVNSNFPPCFISVGNGDPLHEQSEAFARKLSMLNVKVDTLFYAQDYTPLLPHEYQFNLDIAAGKKALEQSIRFLDSLNLTINNRE